MRADNDCADSFGEASADNLRAEIFRLREDNADLRASALTWKGLYEAALATEGDAAVGSVTRGQGRLPAIPVEREHSPSRVAHVVL
jgi:hypothetical protein